MSGILAGMKTPVAPRGSAQFNLRLPDGLRDRIQAVAKRNGRSMNTEIVTRLAMSLDEAPTDMREFLEREFAEIRAELAKTQALLKKRE